MLLLRSFLADYWLALSLSLLFFLSFFHFLNGVITSASLRFL